ncbi:hypothetical protein G436_1002 [Leptospira interrogans serovar Hardjo str. Norma]|uniref:Uncharacterized protein n=1 Tax=Leptospira interrogans serovar Hardjo str. Norma TaxID=1279460 RepID=A0A0M4MSJ1_LEPIR|nr:hypothetical protein G436_1002 [Leptospira interrogans serovar Hardjo str. Norma]
MNLWELLQLRICQLNFGSEHIQVLNLWELSQLRICQLNFGSELHSSFEFVGTLTT